MKASEILSVMLLAGLAAGCSTSGTTLETTATARGRPADPLATGSTAAFAVPEPLPTEQAPPVVLHAVVAVADDRGGRIIDYARQKALWKERGTLVRFDGRCASACTIYLSLPPEQLCVTPSASFAFHRPVARTGQARAGAENYLLGIYPEWVNSWIADQGGLRRGFVTMRYDEARAHIRDCDPAEPLAMRPYKAPSLAL